MGNEGDRFYIYKSGENKKKLNSVPGLFKAKIKKGGANNNVLTAQKRFQFK